MTEGFTQGDAEMMLEALSRVDSGRADSRGFAVQVYSQMWVKYGGWVYMNGVARKLQGAFEDRGISRDEWWSQPKDIRDPFVRMARALAEEEDEDVGE